MDCELEQLKRKLKETEREKEEIAKRMKREKEESERLRLQVQQLQHDNEQKTLQVQQLQRDNLKKDRVIKQVKKENVHYKQNNSIEGLWSDAFPTKFAIEKSYGSVSTTHVDYKRKPATLEEAPFTLLTPSIEPNIVKKPSTLLSFFYQVKEVDRQYIRVNTYGNEADVQAYVHAALTDAVKIFNGLLGGEEALLKARYESSIFSNRPDHVVVGVGSLGTPIFVAETKQPKKKTTNQPANQPPVSTIHDKSGGRSMTTTKSCVLLVIATHSSYCQRSTNLGSLGSRATKIATQSLPPRMKTPDSSNHLRN